MQINSIQEAVKSLQLAKADLEKQLNDVNNAIESLSGSGTVEVVPKLAQNGNYAGYDSYWSLANKFLFLLKKENRFLHFREAADIICQLEGKGEAKELAGKISSSCQALKGETIVKYQAGKSNQDTFWGSPKWLDNSSGEIIAGHQYNGKYLHSKGRKSAPLFDI